jgi:hypothetical protein
MTTLTLLVLVLAHRVAVAPPSDAPPRRPASPPSAAAPAPPDMAEVQARAERILEMLRAEAQHEQARRD